jgi:hypothetical protein
MASVNVSYVSTYPAPDWRRVRRHAYSWSLFGFALLDVILLFGLLNPFVGQPAHGYPLVMNETQAPVAGDAAAEKPSPLGSIVVHKAKTPSRTHVAALQPSF